MSCIFILFCKKIHFESNKLVHTKMRKLNKIKTEVTNGQNLTIFLFKNKKL